MDKVSEPLWLLAIKVVNAKTREEKQAIAATCPPQYIQLLRNAVKHLLIKERKAVAEKRPLPEHFVRIKKRIKGHQNESK